MDSVGMEPSSLLFIMQVLPRHIRHPSAQAMGAGALSFRHPLLNKRRSSLSIRTDAGDSTNFCINFGITWVESTPRTTRR